MPSPRFSSSATDPQPLYEPLTFSPSGRTAPNRFLKAAMSEALSTWDPDNASKRGVPTPEIVNLYRHWGAGGWGLVLTGNIMIDKNQLESRGNLVIPHDAPFSGARFERFTQLAAAAKAHGSLLVAQVSHPGRQSINPDPISASGIQTVAPHMHRKFDVPRAATMEDIERVVAGFVHAAEYLQKAGFDGIELHGAHGYLLSEFFSRATNKRTDKYGGNIENRSRLLLEIAEAIKARVEKSFIIGAKINMVEFNEEGVTPEESSALCEALDKAGFDYIDLSGGNYEKNAFLHHDKSSEKREGFFVSYADNLLTRVESTKLYASGGFKTVGGMVSALGVVHGVGLGRPACQEPRFPKELLKNPKEISGTMATSISPDGYFQSIASAATQIRQISKDQEPVDLTNAELAQQVWTDIMGHFQKIGMDETQRTFGFPDPSVSSQPYQV